MSSRNSQPQAQPATSRQLKKRELDRRAQRLSRERTKARIAYLEQLVEEFRNNDTSGQVRLLTEQLQTVTKERDSLTSLLRTLESSIKQHITPRDGPSDGASSLRCMAMFKGGVPAPTGISPPYDAIPMSLATDAGIQAAPSTSRIEEFDCFQDPSTFLEMTTQLDNDAPPLVGSAFPSDSVVSTSSLEDPIVPAGEPGCDCYRPHHHAPPPPDVNLWRVANEVLTPPSQWVGYDPQEDRDLGYDIAVRAVLEGWPVVEARLGKLPESWKKLRSVDQILFSTCGNTERLAILRLMHSLMMYHSGPSPETRAAIPPWYLQRPSQALVHSYAIDYFVWPGIRERFVFSQHRYCANIFWHLFASSLRLLWPFEFRDAYTTNTETGRLGLSEAFETRIRDIGAWTMTGKFFDRWPELYGDIPRFPHLLSVPTVTLKPPQQQPRSYPPRVPSGIRSVDDDEDDDEALVDNTSQANNPPLTGELAGWNFIV